MTATGQIPRRSALLATDLGPARVTGVVAASAALWRTGAETPAGAYDDRADFDRHSIFGRVDGSPPEPEIS